jgi:hypothetical protein
MPKRNLFCVERILKSPSVKSGIELIDKWKLDNAPNPVAGTGHPKLHLG